MIFIIAMVDCLIWLYTLAIWIFIPLIKHRAMLFTPRRSLAILLLAGFMVVIFFPLLIIFLALWVIIILLQYFLNIDIVVGISREKIRNAIDKVAVGMGLAKLGEERIVIVTTGTQIHIYSLYHLHCVRFINSKSTPKSTLFIQVVRKFITA